MSLSKSTPTTIEEERSVLDESSDQLKDYERVRIVGQGSFGIAVLYRKRNDSTLVVLKQIEMSNLSSSEKEMALNEVDVFSKLHHPNIISYLGSFICSNVLIIEMEYADGGTLAQIISERSADSRYIPERNVVTILEQITSSIKYMHGEHIIHRDLKTANVFLNKKGVVKIGDFGISKMMNTRLHTQTVLGTPYYFSPEMCEGSDYDNKSDIWALGCILGEMCCLRKCFAASNLSELVTMIMSAKYLPLPEQYSTVIRELLRNLLQVDSKQRPAASDILQTWIPQLYSNLQISEEHIETQLVKLQDVSVQIESNEIVPSNMPSTAPIDVSNMSERSIIYQLQPTINSLHIQPISFPKIVRIKEVAHSSSHHIAITLDGFAFAWGEMRHGQIGVGPTDRNYQKTPVRVEHLKSFNIISACAGHQFSVFLSKDGSLFSCGDNYMGCLGDPNAIRLVTPKLIAHFEETHIVQIACGRDQVVAMDSEQVLYSWGTSKFGALGQDSMCKMSNIPSPMIMTMLQRPYRIDKLECGADSTFIILESGELYACGHNVYNRLGLGKHVKRSFQLSPVPGFKHPVVDVCCSNSITVVLVKGGYIYSMGRNDEGQRGLGHCNRVVEPTLVASMKDHFIKQIKCSDTYCAAYSDENVAYIWGTRLVKRSMIEADVNLELYTNNSSISSVFESQLILEPIELLALYSPNTLLDQGIHLQFAGLIPEQHTLIAIVDTNAPLG